MNARTQCLTGTLLLVVTLTTNAESTPTTTCPNTNTPIRTYDSFVQELKARMRAEVPSQLVNHSASNIPSAAETSATAGSKAADSVVSDAGVIKLASLVLGGDMVSSDADTGTVTLTVSPFAVTAMRDQQVLVDQDRYEQFETLRRFNGAVSFFGKGQAIDQDSDGKLDEARTAAKFDDVVSFELRARLWGDRDRRAKENFKKFREATLAPVQVLVDEIAKGPNNVELNQRLASKFPGAVAPYACGGDAVVDEALIWLQQNTDASKAVSESFADTAADVLDRIDNDWIGTLVAGGTTRKEGFGGDEFMVGIRTSWGYAGRNFNASADYTNVNGVGGLPDMDKFKLGVEVEEQFDMLPGGNKSVLSFGAAYELTDGRPKSANEETAKLSLKWTVPVTAEMAAIASLTWANNTELLDGHDDVIGHIGLSFDYEKAVNQMAALSR